MLLLFYKESDLELIVLPRVSVGPELAVYSQLVQEKESSDRLGSLFLY